MSEHEVRAVPGARVPGTWRAECSCGWKGTFYGARGGRRAAVSDKWGHVFDTERAEAVSQR